MNHLSKPIKTAVAVFLKSPKLTNEFLIVKRPADDENLPNVFGLPAVSLANNELPEDAVRRVGKEKLATEINPTKFLGSKYIERETYILILMDIEAELSGVEPDVLLAETKNTKYIAQEWTSDFSRLIEAASKGSLCSQIILDKEGISY